MANNINIKIPNFWSQEYRMSGINCAVLNRLSVAVGTDNVAGGRMLKFSAYNPATRVLTMEGAVGMVGKALFLYTIQDREPRQLLVSYKDPVSKAITLASDPAFSADELAAVTEWRGAVPDLLVEESSFVCGDENFAVGPYGFASGRRSLAAGIGAHAEGTGCRAIGNYALAFGLNADAIGDSAIAIGRAVKVAASCAVLIGDDGELPDTPENAGAFAIANDGLLVIVRKTGTGAELTVNGTVRAAEVTDLEGNPLGGSGGAGEVGMVKSVNGETPDEDGNVAIETGLTEIQVDNRIEALAAPTGYVPAGMVKSVNGEQPDEAGNVTVSASGGGIDAATAAFMSVFN